MDVDTKKYLVEQINIQNKTIDALQKKCEKLEDVIKEQNLIITKMINEIKILKIKSKFLYLD